MWRGWRDAALGVWTLLAVTAVGCMAIRAGFAYALEWMEGNQWYAAYRMAHGLAVYADPNASDFLPHPYPPLQIALAALALRFGGDALWPARLVSIACALICTVLIASAVRRDGRDRVATWIAACLFLGSYFILDTWYDVIRVDMPYTALVLAGFALWARRPRHAGSALAGLMLVGLSSLAKQPGIVIVAVALAAGTLLRQRRWWTTCVTVAAVTATAHALIDVATGGWYRYWVWEMPSRHALALNALVPGGIARAAWMAALPLALAIHARRRGTRTASDGDRVWDIALAATFIACAASYAKVGATINNWLPFAAATCVVTGRALAARPWSRLAPVLLLVQAALCLRDPRTVLPTAADRAAGDRVVTTIAAIPGDVYVMDDAYLAYRAGKTPHMGGMTLGDLHYAGEPSPPALLARLRGAAFSAIVSRYDATDARHTHPVATAIRAAYGGRKIEIPYASERTFMPVAGGRYKPRWILFPSPSPGAAPDSTAPAAQSDASSAAPQSRR